jgi:hypothetical protein
VTLALAYAERFPERVTEMILLSVTLSPAERRPLVRPRDRPVLPEEWARLPGRRPRGRPRRRPRRAYDRLVNGMTLPVERRRKAARDWIHWEDAILSLEAGYVVPNPRWDDERYAIAFARLVTHYFSHAAFLEPDELLGNADRLAGIPAVLVHGRLDLSGPPDVAWALARGLAGCRAPLRRRRPSRRRRDGSVVLRGDDSLLDLEPLVGEGQLLHRDVRALRIERAARPLHRPRPEQFPRHHDGRVVLVLEADRDVPNGADVRRSERR